MNSALKIILKRSSIAGKRPSNSQIEAGEIALNTNAQEPGIFFEVNNGDIVKAGPTAVLPEEPIATPARGETWYNTINGTLSIGTEEEAQKVWRKIAAPYLGGSNYVVFVAPEFSYSTDSLRNDGKALPFQSLNRAVIELTKISIQEILAGQTPESLENRFSIYYAPSLLPIINNPGETVESFSVDFSSDPFKQVTQAELAQFNQVNGGLIIPRGISLIGMDLKKCQIVPTYVPTYKIPYLEGEIAGTNQPRSAVLRLAANSYYADISLRDKLRSRDVYTATLESPSTGVAVFHSLRPHGLSYNDVVNVAFTANVDQSTGTFIAGAYYVNPVDLFTFNLSAEPLSPSTTASYVLFASLQTDLISSTKNVKLVVTNTLYSAHRLAGMRFASEADLADLYTKIQIAFPDFFGGTITPGQDLVAQNEYVIVAPTDTPYPNNTSTNSTKNSSLYCNQVNTRSDYGLCAGDFDGDEVEGFRSVIMNACTSISIQTDPNAYEVYTTFDGITRWRSLPEATYLNIPEEFRPPSILDVPRSTQLDYLNTRAIENIRYYYQNLKNQDGLSFGIVDIDNDFRHFAFRAVSSSYFQAAQLYTIGPAVGIWALNGGYIDLTNCTTNFGSVAFKSEGFRGINTIDGAYDNGKSFLFYGIQNPLALTSVQVESNENKQILSLGARITSVEPDEDNSEMDRINLSSDFSPCYILPYSLKPGTAVWVAAGNCTYRAFLATDGGPTVVTGIGSPGNAYLRVRASDSTIPRDLETIQQLNIPYIRRFIDPRDSFERSYSFVIDNTNQNSLAPQIGSVMRLNQSGQNQSQSLVPNVQFDPGSSGGWGRVFTVDAVSTGKKGLSPNFNYVVGDYSQDTRYIITMTVSDLSRPWLSNYDCGEGTYSTSAFRNWYSAENNLWETIYYDSLSPSQEPYKLSPSASCSPFVTTSVIERQDLVVETFQGEYGADPYLLEYNLDSDTYFRGATYPYPEFPTQAYLDDDDSSNSLGLLLKDVESASTTTIVTAISIVQASQVAAPGQRYRPEIITFEALSSLPIENPRQTVSILKLKTGSYFEYLRVIALNGVSVTAIRLNSENSFFSDPNLPSPSYLWPAGTLAIVCQQNITPNPSAYDPQWSNTKRTVFRFLELMGYSVEDPTISSLFTPKFWGERVIPTSSIPGTPSGGYAVETAQWPLEFNQPSTVIANTHTWGFAGFLNYSRGLPKFQTNDLPKKLSYDFLSTTLWGGRLTITGINEKGELIQFGPQKEALTTKWYEQASPVINVANQQIYEEQPFVEFPSQVMVYSTDDISSQFNGSLQSFALTRNSNVIPSGQLDQNSIFVILGGTLQKPGVNYTVSGGNVTFTTAPSAGMSCNIRVVTSGDNFRTLFVQPLTFEQAFNGTQTSFSTTPEQNICGVQIDADDIIVVIGGVMQIPGTSYTISRLNGEQLVFNFLMNPQESLPAGTTIDIRAICTSPCWANQNIYPVQVYSLDNIAPEFDGAEVTFPLTFDGVPVNPALVTTNNVFVNLGGVLQTPGSSYVISGSEITFSSPPYADPYDPTNFVTCDIRVVTNAQFIPCPSPTGVGETILTWGCPVVNPCFG